MLVLTRRAGESIEIGPITVTILEGSRAGKVRLGIDAPPDIPIKRSELSCSLDEIAASRAAMAG